MDATDSIASTSAEGSYLIRVVKTEVGSPATAFTVALIRRD